MDKDKNSKSKIQKSKFSNKWMRKKKSMKIAVPLEKNRLCMHLGHCERFVIVDVNENNNIVGKEEAEPPLHKPEILPKWLHEKGVNVIIAGGMGRRAEQSFQSYGIQVVVGATSEHPQTVVLNWLEGKLKVGANVCDH